MQNTKFQEMSEILELKLKKENYRTEIKKIRLEIEKEKDLLQALKQKKTRLYSDHMQVWNTDMEIKKHNNKRQ